MPYNPDRNSKQKHPYGRVDANKLGACFRTRVGKNWLKLDLCQPVSQLKLIYMPSGSFNQFKQGNIEFIPPSGINATAINNSAGLYPGGGLNHLPTLFRTGHVSERVPILGHDCLNYSSLAVTSNTNNLLYSGQQRRGRGRRVASSAVLCAGPAVPRPDPARPGGGLLQPLRPELVTGWYRSRNTHPATTHQPRSRTEGSCGVSLQLCDKYRGSGAHCPSLSRTRMTSLVMTSNIRG